jgi:uncharacterized membrane protein
MYAQPQKWKYFIQLWANVKFNSVITLKKDSLMLIVTKLSKYFKQIQQQTNQFAKDNRVLPFITAFLTFLFAAPLLLAVRWASWAESTATACYFALAFSVLLNFVSFGRHRSKNGVVFDGPG